MSCKTIYHTDVSGGNGTIFISRDEMFKKLLDYSVRVPKWDVAIYCGEIPAVRLRSVTLSNLKEKHRVALDDVMTVVMLLGFTQKLGFSVGEVPVHVDWKSVRNIEIIEPHNGQLDVTFQIGTNEKIFLIGLIQ